MADFSALIQRIKDAVYENGVQAITGQILQDCLKDVVNTVNVAKQDGIYRITVSVDNNTGVPSGTARMDDDTYTLELSFHNLKGEKGDKGDKGDTPVLTADSDGVIYSDGVLLTRVIKDTTDALTTRADSDHARAESDHARAETDHTDITRARGDAETAAGEANYASLRANTAADNADAARAAIQSDLATKQDVISDLSQIRAGATNTVKYTSQTLTDAQKEQSRTNIGAASDSEVSQLRSEAGEIGLSELIQSGLTFEQGGILMGGGNNINSNIIRTKDAFKTPKHICLPDGYKINRVSYYSAWTNEQTFTLSSYVDPSPSQREYTFDTTNALVRFSISKSGVNFTPGDFLASFAKNPLGRFDALDADTLSGGKVFKGVTLTNKERTLIQKIPSGSIVENRSAVTISLANYVSSSYSSYQHIEIASGEKVTTTFDVSYLGNYSNNNAISYEILAYTPGGVYIGLLSKIKATEFPVINSVDFEFVTNPPRSDGSSSSSGSFAGYKVSLTGLYDKGVRGLIFRGAVLGSPASGNTVIPGYIYGSGGIECKASLATEPPQSNGWYYLPILATSEYLLASYTINSYYGPQFSPSVVYLVDEVSAEKMRENVMNYDGSITRKTEASLASGSSIMLSDFPSGNEKGLRISFGAKFSSFGGVRIGAGYNEDYAAWFVIDGDNIALYKNKNISTPVDSQAHGLTFATMINVNIEQDDNGAANVIIQTEAGYYQHTFADWGFLACGEITVTSVGGTLTDCELSAYIKDINNPIWFIGASYETPSLYWVKFARQIGYFNYLVNAKPGRGSAASMTELGKLLKLGKPKFLVWTMFGNDGVDVTFEQYIENIIALCVGLDIIPIFVSRPDTPTKDYSARRTVVINSGARYVDEQAALQKTLYADGGLWYDGFLGPDGIHPTDAGSRAIAMQFVKDFPEIMQ